MMLDHCEMRPSHADCDGNGSSSSNSSSSSRSSSVMECIVMPIVMVMVGTDWRGV